MWKYLINKIYTILYFLTELLWDMVFTTQTVNEDTLAATESDINNHLRLHFGALIQ